MGVAKSYFGDIHGLKPYEFIGFRAAIISHTPVCTQDEAFRHRWARRSSPKARSIGCLAASPGEAA